MCPLILIRSHDFLSLEILKVPDLLVALSIEVRSSCAKIDTRVEKVRGYAVTEVCGLPHLLFVSRSVGSIDNHN
jgi:hypothetical protein